MFLEVFEIFSGEVGIISVVLSLFRGIEGFPEGGGGGDIFRVITFFQVHGKIEVYKGEIKFFRNWDFLIGGEL